MSAQPQAPGQPPDGNELMRRVQVGDADAFALLYDSLAPAAYRVAWSICKDEDRANDAVQDGFLSIWRCRASYRAERGSARAWAMTVVRNRSIDALRRDRSLDRHRVDGDGVAERLHAKDNVEDEAIDRDQAEGLRDLLTTLPLAQREVVALAYFGGLTHSEIATHLALPAGTIKGRMRLGLDKLRAGIVQQTPPADRVRALRSRGHGHRWSNDLRATD
ncbi:MAG: sigma-70 family RNA polymerase sigma factor [Thermoleophilaceae bacterium]